MKKTLSRSLVVCVLCLLLSVFGMIFVNKAPTYATEESPFATLSLKDGAAVRIGKTYESNGLKYRLIMDKTAYESLDDLGVENVTYGIFILPVSYGVLQKSEVYGDQAKYDWAIYNAETSKWEYNGTKTRIMNLYSNELNEFDANTVYFDGAIINILEKNLMTEFQGVGYVKYTLNGVEDMILVGDSDNHRSVVEVAQAAIANVSETNNLSDNQKNLLKSYYLTQNVVETETTYTVVKNYENWDKTVDVVTEKVTAKVNESVEIALEDGDFTLDSSYDNVLSGIVKPNGKLTLTVNYKPVAKTIDTSSITLFDKKAETLAFNEADVLYEVVNGKGYKVNASVNDGNLVTDGLSGIYAYYNGETTTVYDIYSSDVNEYTIAIEDMFTYDRDGNVVTKTNERGTFAVSQYLNNYARVYYSGTNYESERNAAPAILDGETVLELNSRPDNKDQFALQLVPMHSKEYYQALVNENANYVLSFDFRVDTVTSASFWHIYDFMHGTNGINNRTNLDSHTWYRHTIKLSDIVNNWDNLAVIGAEGNTHTNTSIIRAYREAKIAHFYVKDFAIGYDATLTETVAESVKINTTETPNYSLTDDIVAVENILDVNTYNLTWNLLDSNDEVVLSDIGATFDATNLFGDYTLQCVVSSKLFTPSYKPTTQVVYSKTINIHDGFSIELITDTSLHLYVGNTADSFDLSSVLPTDDKVMQKVSLGAVTLDYEMVKPDINANYSGVGAVDYTSKLNGSIIKAEDLTVGYYNVTVNATYNGSTTAYYTYTLDYDKDATKIYTIAVEDMLEYDENNELKTFTNSKGTHNDSTYLREYATVYYAGNSTQASYPASPILLDETTYGRDGYYIELHTRTDNKDQFALRLRAVHSKAYYQAIVDENENAALTFDYYVETTESVTAQFYSFVNSTAKKQTSNTWYSYSIKVSDIINSWDNIHTNEGLTATTTMYKTSSIARVYYSTKAKFTDVYVGNFAITLPEA